MQNCLLYFQQLEYSHLLFPKITFKTSLREITPLPFLHLNYLSPSVNGNTFYLAGIVKLNSLVPAAMLKSLERECHPCQVLYYHSSSK